MPRYIDADALKPDYIVPSTSTGTVNTQYVSLSQILDAPTADVVERKKGQWIRENIVLTSNPPQYQWHCSVCGKMVHWFTTGVLTNFCPNCGADMRKETEDGKEDS